MPSLQLYSSLENQQPIVTVKTSNLAARGSRTGLTGRMHLKKTKMIQLCLQDTQFTLKDTNRLTVKGLKTCIMQIVLKKRAGTFILLSDKIVTRNIL